MDYLNRHVEEQILEAAQHFKAILLLGARQVGKSTLLTHLFPTIKTFVFDPVQDLYRAKADPDLFLASFPAPLILDEVQYAPELVAALKRKMDASEAKGQYFLTGSQNFSMLRTVAESMAGRVAVFHLENLTPYEMLHRGQESCWITKYLDNPTIFYQKCTKTPATFFSLMELLYRGTFPATMTLPTLQIGRYFSSYLQTYVDRDIRTQEEIRHLSEFNRFLGLCASLTAQELNFSQLGREIGISPGTASRWRDLLIYSYQWLELMPYHGNTIKRISGKSKGYFKDTGFACYLQRIESIEGLMQSPRLGAIFETWVVNYLFQQCSALSVPPNFFHWRTAAGAEVDLVLEKDGKLFPIEIKCKTVLSKSDCRGLKAFRETYSNKDIMPALVIYAGEEPFQLDQDTIAIPWNLL